MPVEQSFDLRRSSFGTVHSIRLPYDAPQPAPARPVLEPQPSFQGRAFNYTVIMLTVALVLVSYHQMAFTSLIPIHLLDKPAQPTGHLDLRGGLGYTVHDVGIYLAVNGVLGLLIQGLIFPIYVDKVGVWETFVINVVLYPLAYLVMPFVSAFPAGLVSPGIYLSLILQSLFGILVIPCALILLKDATPSPAVLGRVNGLAMSACCLARTVGPPLVGIIYAAGGSAAAWFSCLGFAILGAIQLLMVPRKHVNGVEVESLLHKTDSHPAPRGPLVEGSQGHGTGP